MRNIIFIRVAIAAAIATLAGAPVLAQTAPPLGCFERDYSANHLAGQPAQVVDDIRLKIYARAGEIEARMQVLTANQGHARRAGQGGQWFAQYLYCFEDQGGKNPWYCNVECDGGSFEVTRDDGKILEFSTNYLMVGETDDCGGAIDLAEVQNRNVTYRLYRVAAARCDGM